MLYIKENMYKNAAPQRKYMYKNAVTTKSQNMHNISK